MGAMDVAVKQLQPGASEEETIMFLQEAATNGQFRHPNVVQLMGVLTMGEQVSGLYMWAFTFIHSCVHVDHDCIRTALKWRSLQLSHQTTTSVSLSPLDPCLCLLSLHLQDLKGWSLPLLTNSYF